MLVGRARTPARPLAVTLADQQRTRDEQTAACRRSGAAAPTNGAAPQRACPSEEVRRVATETSTADSAGLGSHTLRPRVLPWKEWQWQWLGG
jgi:hypothetical protein